MAKRVHIQKTHTYMAVRERNTSAGNKGTFIGKWSSNSSTAGTAQERVGRVGATISINQYGNTLKWLGGADQKHKK